MGEYLNPGCEDFQMAINSEVFVDKTEILGFLNTLIATEQRHVCISRPRRFGKTMTAKMLCAYYGNGEGARELFQARKVAQLTNWDSHLGKYNVIRLVMTEFIKTGVPVSEALAKMQRRVLTELASEYPDVKYDSEDFRYSLSRFRQNSRKRYVVIIDEWDVIFRAHPGDGDGQKMYLEYLRDWLKDNGDVALAYMTGILPVKKYGAHSALNMFTEYSMTSPKQLAQFTGFTTQEVKSLCQEFGRDYSSIADWYDGYVVNDIIPGRQTQSQKYHLFSPLSVVNAIITGQIRNYWNSTETYEALAEYIRKDFDDLKQAVTLLMDGGRVRIDIGGYQNDMTTFECRDDILTLLVHLGYLGYDEETSEVFIPNQEVLAEFRLSTRTSEWVEVLESFRKSQKLLQATWDTGILFPSNVR